MEQVNILTAPRAVGAGGRRQVSLKALLGRFFGCHHAQLSRPFTRDGSTYRVCLGCGARKGFDLRSWTTYGPFYNDN